MKVLRTEQIHIEGTDTISYLCHLSKNLYNQVNYILRGQFFKHERMISYKDLAKQFSRPSEVDENNNFQKLPAQTAQWTIKKGKTVMEFILQVHEIMEEASGTIQGNAKTTEIQEQGW